MRHRRYLIAILVSLFLTLAPAAAARAQSALASWTILVYLDGDNNLEREAIDDFLEMSAVGSNEDINVVVQFDRIGGYDRRYGDWTSTMRFLVAPGMTPEPANAIRDLGEANMGDPQTLIDFVEWGRATFPAQRTAVVLWNHGDGWRTASFLKQRRKAIAWDDTNGGDALDLAELRDALSVVTDGGAWPIDLLAFDACLMAMIEIDVQIQSYVHVRTASEETEPGTGYPFDDILEDLRAHPEWDAADLGRGIVASYYAAYEGETQSAVDLGDGYAIVISAVDDLAQALLASQADHPEAIQTARRETQQFQVHYVDLYDLAAQLAAVVDVEAVQRAAQEVMDAIDAVVLAEGHGSYWPGAHGITIYFPAQPSGWDSAYDGSNDYLLFTAETQWDEFLIAYLALAGACDQDEYEPDNGPDTATPLTVDGLSQDHTFCPESDTADWVSFEAQAGQSYEIATSDLASDTDTVLRLYDTDGQTQLDQDDDSGSGWASKIEWTSPVSGTYYVAVTDYYGRAGPNTGYAVGIGSLIPACQVDAHEPDGDPAAAAAILVDRPPQAHNFCAQDDLADWAMLEGVQGETYIIETLDLGPDADTVLTLFEVNGTTVLLTDDNGGVAPFSSRLEWTCPLSGPYPVRVHHAQGGTGPDTDYGLRVSTAPFVVHGTVRLQGRATFEGTQVTVAAGPYMATTNISGTFSVTATVPCTIVAQHAGYLPAQWAITTTTEIAPDLETVTLWGGDINGDRRIDILDLAYVGGHFGSGDPAADLNNDGTVNILDLVMTASNFGKMQ
jgi:cysteine peptidase C11 family protein/pre-peptidase/dockerin type I repeat protein